MIKKPKVSVVMTVYNPGIYLSETIESILNQSFKDFELIIVNDKSTDNSLDTIKKYMKKDNRIILIDNKKNVGPTASLNIGLDHVKGKYIAISDHDDISLPKRLETEYKFLEKNNDIFLVGSGVINIDEMGNELSIFNPIINLKKVKKMMFYTNCFSHPTIMFRNEGVMRYREKIYYAHDRDFYLNLLSNGKRITNIRNILVKYRIHKNQLSVSNRAYQYLFAEKAKEFYHQRLKYGKDDYNKFNPKEIFDFKIQNCKDLNLLNAVGHSNFISGNYTEAAVFFKRYIKDKGFFNKTFIKYLLSKLGMKSKIFDNFNRFLIRFLG